MTARFCLAALAALAPIAHAWMPSGKIRGVNLGNLFVYEPWLDSANWTAMGCTDSGYNSEFDCMSLLGQSAGDTTFHSHWTTWVTESDFADMISYGLNAVRIPLGYWMNETLVFTDSEHFPRGGFDVLKTVCGWASDKGMYIILDLHGAPGAQVPQNANTGQYASTPGFYQRDQFDRATEFVSWLRQMIYENEEMRHVGMIEIVNEPLQWQGSETLALRQTYYPAAYNAIRDVESSLGITGDKVVHVEFMNSQWGSGDPTEYLPANASDLAFDDHRYLKYSPDTSSNVSHDGYLSTSCNDNRTGPGDETAAATVVGEFSLSVPDNVQDTADWDPSTDANKDFYKLWFAAQVMAYERSAAGWFFWTWKANLNDYRWSYRDAVAAGVIPENLDSIANSGACDRF